MSNALSKLKATPIKKLKERIDKDDSITGSNSFGNELKFEDGKTTKIRLFPPHPGNEDFYVLEKKHWLTIEKENGEAGRTTVLNSIVHGGTKLDIIDSYIDFAKKNLKDADKLKLITDWKTGLQGKHSWIAYALKITSEERKFGLISFPKSVRDDINKKAQIEDEDEPIEVDPFTDPETGLPLLVKYLSKPNKKKGEDYYSVDVGKKAVPLTEEEAEVFMAAKPLTEIYNNVYSVRDFERALNGLQYFDTENEIEIMENEDFLEIIEKVRAQYDGSEEEEDKPKKKGLDKKASKSKKEEEEEEETKPAKKAAKKKVVVEEEEEEEEEEEVEEEEEAAEADEYDEMDRNELKRFIVKNKLEIAVKTSFSEDDIRNLIREALKTEEEETEEEEEEVEEEEETKPVKKAAKKKVVEEEEEEEETEEEEEEKPKKKMSMADIKAKIANKGK